MVLFTSLEILVYLVQRLTSIAECGGRCVYIHVFIFFLYSSKT